MPDVRLKFQPGNIQKVSEQEFTDLDRQGLVLEVITPQAPPSVKPHPVPIKVTSTSGEGKSK